MEKTTPSRWLRPFFFAALAVLGALFVLEGDLVSALTSLSVVVAFLGGAVSEFFLYRRATETLWNRGYEAMLTVVFAVLLLATVPIVTDQEFAAIGLIAGTAVGALVSSLAGADRPR